MGEAEFIRTSRTVLLHATIVTYGHAADERITEQIRREIEDMWNAPQGKVYLSDQEWIFRCSIKGICIPDIDPTEVVSNTDPRMNFFRIEERSINHISFVDGLGCNTGYFQVDNLYEGSTTAAHEFGHTLGLDHPRDLDIRGYGRPGIMYPRGTLVDPEFQYDPQVPAGMPGGTMHPMHRRVSQSDINLLRLHRLRLRGNFAIVGDFSNQYHPDHGPWMDQTS